MKGVEGLPGCQTSVSTINVHKSFGKAIEIDQTGIRYISIVKTSQMVFTGEKNERLCHPRWKDVVVDFWNKILCSGGI